MEAFAGAQIVVDVSNSPSWSDDAVMEFFKTSTGNLLAAEKAAGIRHHVALSVVGADRMPSSGYMRAKITQEGLIQSGGCRIPSFGPHSSTSSSEELPDRLSSGCRPPPCSRWPRMTWRPLWPTSL